MITTGLYIFNTSKHNINIKILYGAGNTYKMKIDNDNNYTSKNVKVNIDCSNSFQKIGKLIKVD